MKRTYHWLNHVLNFLAVILGVYLAFYINERAKVNQDRKESRLLMNSLMEDLSEDIRVYEEYQIPANIQHHGNLQVSGNSRYLVHKDGTPFLWLGCTAWGIDRKSVV